MWTIVLLAGAIAAAYAVIRRFRLERERRERSLSVEAVDSAFLRTSQNFSVDQAAELVRAIRDGRQLRVKLLNPELSQLEVSLDSVSQWSYGAVDPEQDRAALLQRVIQLYKKWQNVRDAI